MAMRGGAARRLPGNPLGGLLRDMDRRTRTTTRRARPAGAPQPEAAPPAAEPAPRPVERQAAVLTTGEDGRLRWTYGRPFAQPPVLTAVPVDPAPDSDLGTVVVALEAVTETYTYARAWRVGQRGKAVAAGPGVTVHMTASPPG
ncbi:hypothetical protein QEH48_gp031 [Streptomyces phage TurkishDelight]|uniref:Uncharacterized protein n=1 Tax=Streptomyces phage TurkishDelight TaxID=2793708 RepID=A0A7T0Q3C7_9CAUD|nr:hypothetical protein QEH48_gp031 [Streptomyces phage TurkishDelight]QPL14060.1 hypothetical protein SEA_TURKISHDELIGHT_31 [Streptomyces phage TurkishDelight]